MSQQDLLADFPVAILAGGMATRMRPFTETIPKALLEVAGEPFVAHQLRLLESAGFRRVVLCVGYRGEQIESYLGDGSHFGLEVTYAFDGATLRGTGGALQHASAQLGSQFVVLYGDSYLPIDYRAVVTAFLQSRQPAMMVVYRNEGRWDTSNVLFEAGQIRCYSKRMRDPQMQYIDYGVAVVRADMIISPDGRESFDLADIYSGLAEDGRLAGFEVKQRFYEIGSPEGLRELDCLLREKADKVNS